MVQVKLRRPRQKRGRWTLILLGLFIVIIWTRWREDDDDDGVVWIKPQLLALDKELRRVKVNTPAVPIIEEEKQGQLRSVDNGIPRSSGGAIPSWLGEEWKNEECIPYAPWQVQERKPATCNLFHEMDVAEPEALQFIACGGARCAFSIDSDMDGKIVLKWTKGSKYSSKIFEATMKDTMAMERLQHSDYILKVYGNCGSSQMLEAASQGALYDQIVVAKNTENEPDGLLNDPEENLRVYYHLAKSAADVHGIDGPDAVTFTHNDLDCSQYIFIDGVYKLNDFHYSSMEFRNRTSGLGCRQKSVKWGRKSTKLRAPEEFVPERGNKIHRDQVDVWMLGDVFYYVLTKKWVMEGRTNQEVKQLYAKGRRADIPSFIQESRHPAHRAMIKALRMAWTFDPDKRPTARKIANFLEQELIAINDGKSDAPWRVSVRPMPNDYSFSSGPENKISSFVAWHDNYKVFSGD